MTGGQTIEYFANLRGGVDPVYQAELISRLDVDPTRKFKEYSKGNKQKIGLIAAFQHRPDLLILDEPTSGLDPLVQQTFYEIIREAKQDGRTVFLSSHILSEVEKTCDRVAIIRDGRLVKVDRVEALRDLAHHQVELRFTRPVPRAAFEGLDGVSDVVVTDHTLTMRVSGSILPVVPGGLALRGRRLRVARALARGDVPRRVPPRRGRGGRHGDRHAIEPGVGRPRPAHRPALQRLAGYGSVFGKTIRDSRRATILAASASGSSSSA